MTPTETANLIEVVQASLAKVRAGVEHQATHEHSQPGYPPGLIEVGVALDALNMVEQDLKRFLTTGAHPCHS